MAAQASGGAAWFCPAWVGAIRLAAACLFLLLASDWAAAAERPFLQLDTGGHMALIRSVVFTPDGTRLISASDDKTVRVWDAGSGRTVMTLRGQIADGEAGKIFAVAVSRDGRWLAAGGRTRTADTQGHPIRIYDLESGRLVALLDGHADAVLSLEFSRDGARLLSGGVDDVAVLWDLAGRRAIHRLQGHQGDVNAARFTLDGERIVTASDDKTLRLWNVRDGRPVAELKGHADVVMAVAVSPADGTIASGARDRTIRLWDPRTGRFLRQLADQDSEVMSLSFSPDGARLLSGAGSKPFQPQVRDVATGRVVLAYPGHDNVALAVAISPDGRLAATAGSHDNEVHLWEAATGRPVLRLAGIGQAVWSVGIAADGREIAWGSESHGASPNELGRLTHVLRLPAGNRAIGEPRPIAANDTRFLRALARQGAIALSHRSSGQFGYVDTLDIARGGQLVALAVRGEADGYAHNAYTLTAGGTEFIAGGGHGALSAYDLAGRKRGEFIGHTSDVWALAASADGKLLLSGSDDQTLRLWNLPSRENIVSLFRGRNGEWVMWTPQGYFSASPDGDEHVGWHINQGPAQAARFVTAAQLKRHFYRPDILQRALLLSSAVGAIGEAAATGFSLDELLRRKPPEFSIVSPPNRAASVAAEATLTVAAAADQDPIEVFEITVNDRKVNIGVQQATGGGRTFSFQVPLSNGDNRIVVAASNAVGRTVRELVLVHKSDGAPVRRGTLFLVSIGVDEYPHFGQNLEFAGADARAFHKMMLERTGALHAQVRSLVLAKGGDQEPTARNVRAALRMFEEAKPEDTVILFLAGHGVNDGPNYLFLPSDARHFDKKWQSGTVVNWFALQTVLEQAQGRRIMLVDTCHAGNAFNARLVKDADDASIVVFAATDAETVAQERRDLGHGVFTHAVLKGLEGAADLVPDRQVKAQELSRFVSDTVNSMTQGKQVPTTHLSKSVDFVVSRF